jgi:hypothetical protein
MRTLVQRPIGSNCYSSQFTVKAVKHLDSVTVWGSFSAAGCGGLYFLSRNTTMNVERYKKVLQDDLLPCMEFHRTTHFLQDGAPCHVSKRIKNFLVDKPFEVFKTCWNFLKENLNDKDTGSVNKLITAINMPWVKDLSRDYLKKLSNLMPRRIQKVLDEKEDTTSYSLYDFR